MGNSTRLTLCDARGPLNDLFEKLSGDDGGQWFDGLKRFLRKENPFDASPPDINWALVYEKLGMGAEYAKTLKDMSYPGLWVVPMVPGLTCNKVVAGYRGLDVQVYTYTDDLNKNVTQNDRDPNRDGPYFVCFRRIIEADDENKGLSASTLATRGHKGSTLLERLVLGFGYYVTTGQHLDVQCVTLCSGSRHSGGSVPSVRWDSDSRRVNVRWCNPGHASGCLRSRSAVSLSVNPKD